MRQAATTLTVATQGTGLVEVTAPVRRWVAEQGMRTGLLTVFCRHTSASLTIQENADPDVQSDLVRFFRRLVAEDPSLYDHTAEGPDDMPAHIRSALTGVSLSIPVMGGSRRSAPGRGSTCSSTAPGRTAANWRCICWGSDGSSIPKNFSSIRKAPVSGRSLD